VTRDFPEGYLPLCRRFGFDEGIPWTRHWSAAPDFLERAVAEVAASSVAQVLECGSGLSTLMLAAACRERGGGLVTALEQWPEGAAATREALARYRLEAYARVVDAPLVSWRLEGEIWPWYRLDEAVLPEAVTLLVVDGPPGRLRPLARYPALPLLGARLAPGWRLLLDDAARPDERRVVARWLRRRPDLAHEYLPLERGCSRLWSTRPPPHGGA